MTDVVGRDKIEQSGAFSKAIIDNSVNKELKREGNLKKVVIGVITGLIIVVLEEVIRRTLF